MSPRMHDSPMPMKMMFGSVSETATAPTDELRICPSVMLFQETPPSVVFHSPPPVWPAYPSFGWPFTPLIAIDRPARSGPMLRQRSVLEMRVSMGAGRAGRDPMDDRSYANSVGTALAPAI